MIATLAEPRVRRTASSAAAARRAAGRARPRRRRRTPTRRAARLPARQARRDRRRSRRPRARAPSRSDRSGPHVLVSDISLPDQDGYAFIRELRASGPDDGGWMPAIAISGHVAPDDVKRAILAGFQLHLGKPIDPHDLDRAARAAGGGEPLEGPDGWHSNTGTRIGSPPVCTGLDALLNGGLVTGGVYLIMGRPAPARRRSVTRPASLTWPKRPRRLRHAARRDARAHASQPDLDGVLQAEPIGTQIAYVGAYLVLREES